MRIVTFASSYPRYPGDGAAPFVQSLARALARQGHQVTVVAPYDVAVRPTPPEPNLRVVRFRYVWPAHWHVLGHARALENDERLRLLALVLLPLFLAAGLVTLLVTAVRQGAELLHAHWVLPNGLLAALVSRLLRVPLVISLHGSDIFLARRVRLFGLVAGWVLRQATVVTACSPELGAVARALSGREDIALLPWGADPAVFRPRPRPEGPFTVVALGRLVAKKGFDVLLAAWPRVAAAVPGARLRLGGEGPLRPVLVQAATSGVELLGALPWDETPRFLAEADLFVLPSRRDNAGNVDGLPTVLLEAMGCGVAVVASDIGGVALVVENGQNGVLVPPGDPVALAEAMIALARDPARRQALGAAARRTVEERLTWDAVARRVLALVESAGGRRPVSRQRSIPPRVYDRAYYLDHMEGAAEFVASGGEALSPRLAFTLELVDCSPGQRVLDLGCGRGEVVWHLARAGVDAHGADFSRDALFIARELRGQGARAPQLEAATATALPYRDESFDTVLMLDLVEHLYPEELLAAFREVRRVLRPRGRLVVHTMPNADYYRWGYPLYRLLARLAGQRLPKDPRQRWYRGETHVNIQTPRRLRRTLREAGFPVVDVWLEPLTGGRLATLLARPPLLRTLLANDIFAVAEKR
ncbi:MAG: glycosyltransferase [Chloroflexi bacterium]|nr:glycosyltransferase [Chloroflexota bacterium]